MNLDKYIFIVAVALNVSVNVVAESVEEKGLKIAVEAEKYDSGWNSSIANMDMRVINKSGKESYRRLLVKSLEVENDGDKSLTIFDSPRDVRGTALLTFSHQEKNDDQWLYLPALKRVKRISASNKSGPFMGSEFSFEDLASQEVGKYSYKYVKDEECGGRNCFVIERVPVDHNSGYSRHVVWVDKETYRTHKVDYYDRKKILLKTLTSSKYKQYLNHYWRPAYSQMINHQSGKSTVLSWSDYQFDTNLKGSDFTKVSLKRGR